MKNWEPSQMAKKQGQCSRYSD